MGKYNLLEVKVVVVCRYGLRWIFRDCVGSLTFSSAPLDAPTG